MAANSHLTLVATDAPARQPLSGWRGEPDRQGRHATPAKRARRCPFCGPSPGPATTEWCPSFDRLLEQAVARLSSEHAVQRAA